MLFPHIRQQYIFLDFLVVAAAVVTIAAVVVVVVVVVAVVAVAVEEEEEDVATAAAAAAFLCLHSVVLEIFFTTAFEGDWTVAMTAGDRTALEDRAVD